MPDEIGTEKIRNIVVISDTHFGCRQAPCPPEGVALDDGGDYYPSDFQEALNARWDYFWNTWVPEATEGEPYDSVDNGDSIDGVHHNSTTQISHNISDQKKIARIMLAPIFDKCKAMGGRIYWIRGTEAHVGVSGKEENELAETMGATPNAQGQYARWELWKDLCGSLIHFTHHIGTTGSMAYEGTALNKELTEMYIEAARWGLRCPDLVCRAHRHRYFKVEFATSKLRGTGVIGPGWQGRSPFTYKIAGGRVSAPQIGGYMIRKAHDGALFTKEMVWNVDRTPVVE